MFIFYCLSTNKQPKCNMYIKPVIQHGVMNKVMKWSHITKVIREPIE